jgi:hypothetical protein
MGIKHVFVSTVADGSTAEHILPSNWNADHTIDGAVILSSGTATNTPLQFVAGNLHSAPDDGVMEFDGTCFYNTATAGARRVSVSPQIVTQTTTRALTTSTDAQKIFNATTNGAVTVGPGTYFWECQGAVTGMSSATKNVGFGLAGTATFTQKFWHIGKPAAAIGTILNTQLGYFTALSTQVITATTLSTYVFQAKGRAIVTSSGTIIPSIQISNQNATAATLANNAVFSIWPIGSSVAAFVGNWS